MLDQRDPVGNVEADSCPPLFFLSDIGIICLIEKCNLKGYNINGAEVSIKHANFIVNTGNARGKDIVKLMLLWEIKRY